MTKLMTLPMILVFLGSLITIFGVLLATYNDNREKLKAATDKVKFEKELRLKNEEIIHLTNKNKEFITGGNSYPYLSPSIIVKSRQKEREAIGFMIMNHNEDCEYPLYDVKIEVLDVDKFSKIVASAESNDLSAKKQTLRKAKKEASTFIDVGNLGANQCLQNQIEFEMPLAVQKREFSISTSARNGNTKQKVTFIRVSDEKITVEEELFVHGKKIEK